MVTANNARNDVEFLEKQEYRVVGVAEV